MKTKFITVITAVCLLLVTKSFSQVTTGSNIPGGGTEYLGWANSGTAKDVDVTNNFSSQNINFSTHDGTTVSQKMIILGNPGYVGIGSAALGTNFTTFPNHWLDVDQGDININRLDHGYRIGGFGTTTSDFVLWHNGRITNIFVGVGAGINASNTGVYNTFAGNNAGFSNTSGSSNTFVGHLTGFSNNTGNWNTYVGDSAGYTNQSGVRNTIVGNLAGFHNYSNFNTFVGDSAGYSNTEGQGNTFLGYTAGRSNIAYANASWNTFVGYKAGRLSTIGGSNCFYGKKSGESNTTGSSNVFMGAHSGISNSTGYFNIFIGDDAARNSSQGDSNVVVGREAGISLQGDDNNGNYDTRNVFIGCSAASSTKGDENVIIGPNANSSSAGTNNAIAIGADAVVMNTNQMILGRNDVNVGIGLSGNSTGPRNKLEINHGTAGFSGLQFTQMTSGSTPTTPNPSNNVLSVDANGVVILVPDANGGGNVSACSGGGSPTYLPLWSGTNEICNSIVFEQSATRIGISTVNPIAKLDVQNTVGAIGGLLESRTNPFPLNIGGMGRASMGSIANVGLWGQAAVPITFPSTVTYGSLATNAFNAGVVGQGEGSYYNFGGVFEANRFVCHAVNIGVYASAVKTCDMPAVAGLFNGSVYRNGNDNFISDIKVKDSISDISNALSVIADLRPKHFVFKTDSFPYMNLPEGGQLGFISQQVDSILPVLITEFINPSISDTDGTVLVDTIRFKAMNYVGLIPLAIAGIQEQQAIIDSLAGDKVSACVGVGATPANYLPKWDSINKVLCNSIIQDIGTNVGIPTVAAGTMLNVANSADSVTATFSSTNTTTTKVVKAVYSTNSSMNKVAAVSGYSKYVNGSTEDDGVGGTFEGGMHGVYGLVSGTHQIQAGIFGESKNATQGNIGVAGFSQTATDSANAGVLGMASEGEYANIGVWGVGEFVNSTSINTGVNGFAAGSDNQNMGGDFEAWDTLGTNYGIYAYANGSAPDFYAGYFDGDVHVVGSITTSSDARLKSNIQNIQSDNALASVLRLEPKSYEYRRGDYPGLSLPSGTQYGLIAQDVEQVLPHLVSDIKQPETRDRFGKVISTKLDYKGINYTGLIPLLIGAVKDQQEKIDSLEEVIDDRLNALEARINQCCGSGSLPEGSSGKTDENTHRQTVELSSLQVIVLEQNVPNPFAEQTNISYFIPEDAGDAVVMFFDVSGKVLKTVDVQKGQGILTVFGPNLGSGTYSYSLIVDGKAFETKRMVKMK